MHEDGYEYEGDRSLFLKSCDLAITELNEIIELRDDPNGSGRRKRLAWVALCYVMAFLMPLIGLVLGVKLFVQAGRYHALRVLLISIIMIPCWWFILRGLFPAAFHH